MKNKNIYIMLSLLLVTFLCISSVAASEDNFDDNNLTVDSPIGELNANEEYNLNDNQLGASNDAILSEPKTIVVDNYGETHVEMNDHTIRTAIQSANDGDTIIIRGESYEHCHLQIDKKVTIKSEVGTNLSACSSTAFSNHRGEFYLTSGASGTIIEGFNFVFDSSTPLRTDDYHILIDGASNIIIRNCTFSNNNIADAIRLENARNTVIQNVSISETVNGIKIKNSNGVTVKDSIIEDSKYGINDVDSTKTIINSNNILNNEVGVLFAGSSNNPTVNFNNITNNEKGIELTSSNNINILSNYIALNSMYGVYVDCQIQQINIIGNFFYKNSFTDGGEVFNSENAQGIWKQGGEKLEVLNNNYMVGNNVRPINRDGKGGVFLGYTFVINENVNCPILYFEYGARWYSGDYRLQLTEIKQSKKGIYTISLINPNGEVAKGLSSVPVIFYLNKDNNYVAPQEGDVYKTVMMVDGTATARFYPEDFKESGNVVTVVLPGTSEYITGDQNKNVKKFNVDDNYIPGNITPTKIAVSNLNTYPNSNVNFIATVTDIYNNPVVNEPVTFTIGTKTVKAVTDAKGQATIKIRQNVGTYTVKVNYAGDDVDYSASNAQAKITVQKVSTNIVASNYAMFIKKADYYQLTLKDSSNKPLSGQKVTIKVNKKTYTKTTNAKGIAKLKLKLKKGTYKVVMNYKGTNKYTAAKKTTKIYVKKVLKTKLVAPKITTTPKTKTKYSITLKDENSKVLKKQKVTVKVNGKKYTKKTNSKGQVTIKVKFSKLKSYKVKANYKKTKSYKKSSATGKITVQKTVTKITAPNMNTIPNTAKDYTVTLKTNDGKAISGQTLKINLNCITYTKTTNSKGQISIQTKFATENTYKATVTYAGSAIYKNAKATGTIKVARTPTTLTSYDRTFSKNSAESYTITLEDSSGKALADQLISYTLNNQSYSQKSDKNGQIKVDVSSLSVGSYDIISKYAQTNQYKASAANNVITILNKTGVTFIDAGIPGDEIQARFNEAKNSVEFLGNNYNDVSLTIDKALNITFMPNTTLNGKSKSPVLTIAASNLNISNLAINAHEGSGIIIKNANNVTLENNTILNVLDQSKISEYNSGNLIIPGNGIEISNAENIKVIKNVVESFGNAIFVQNTDDLEINNNTLSLSNYGINYDSGVKNTNITNNLITKNIGLYVMDIPEGPLGYGIFLNKSAVNVSITQNKILDNYMGISVDSNFSTGIVILSNWISDNALEGIRFNAGYDLAENAVEPNVNDNAIYRNAKGPSMMILGELSANPEGIYQYGLYNDSKRLQLGANWFGKNARITWDYETNTTGYGTMCPRVNAVYLSVKEIEVITPGTYSITFYKYDEVASKLPVFEMYATLNDIELKFNVVNGVGVFSFNATDFSSDANMLKISIGSLKDEYRTFEVLLNKTLQTNETLTQ